MDDRRVFLTEERVIELRAAAERGLAAGVGELMLQLHPDELLQLLDSLPAELPNAHGGILPPRRREGHWEVSPETERRHRSTGEALPPALVPPATPGPGAALRPDHNYHFALTDLQVDEQAREGHGWARSRPDGAHAKCGGPKICGVCRREVELVEAGEVS